MKYYIREKDVENNGRKGLVFMQVAGRLWRKWDVFPVIVPEYEQEG